MSLPVYLIHFNAPDWCRSATRSILSSDIPIAVTVVNNGGELDLDADVRILTPRKNAGYAGGANVALRDWLSGTEPYCLVGSHDLHLESDTIRRLVEAADLAPPFGILGPRTSTNWAGEWLDTQYGIEVRTGMSGTCLLFRRDCIAEIGLFDETFRSYAEDNEICARARKHGWLVGLVPAARAEGRGTGDSDYRTLNTHANRLLLGWRVEGLKGCLSSYLFLLKRFRRSFSSHTDYTPVSVLHETALGTARLMAGIVRRPPSVGS